jgi:acyl dehydratase
MTIDYQDLMSRKARHEEVTFTDRDVMLYAMSVGFGRDPLKAKELPYVYEGAGLRAVPALASTLTSSAFLDDCGWDYSRILHGEERLTIHRPLGESGTLILDSDVTDVFDKGTEGGAVILTETRARLANDDAPAFTVRRTILARGDGGFGGPAGSGPTVQPIPQREPDLVSSLPTRRDQALLFRLSGDRNPLHADPALAKRLGLPAPILHGLCSFGIACRAILKTICEYDQTLITAIDVRFSAPVYPGETLVTEMWQEANVVSYRVRAAERDLVVLDYGRCVLAT